MIWELDAWTWAGLGLILIAAEMIGAGGYLLLMGLSAITVALITALLPVISWQWQLGLFAVDMLTMTVAWKKLYKRQAKSRLEDSGLNRRGSEFIGREFVLHEAIEEGHGKIKAGDTLWLVMGDHLPAGTRVRVVGMVGAILQVVATS